jgi:hypothetical protein
MLRTSVVPTILKTGFRVNVIPSEALGSTTLPTLLGAPTDMALRAKGIQSYGIGPAATDEDQIKYGAHSHVERLLELSLYGLAEFTWRVVLEVAGSR